MHFSRFQLRLLILDLALTICAGLTLAACKFESSIPTLQFPTAPPQPFQQFSPQEAEPPPPFEEAPPSSSELSTIDSATALTVCGQELSWGDETVGMCLAPGGASYFVWTNEGNAIQVPINPLDFSQAGFREAAEARAGAVEEVRSELRSIIFEGIGFGASLAAFVPACATVLGCAVDIVALSVTGGLLAESGNSIVTNVDTFDSSAVQADYFYCRMQGESDSACRESSGISDEVIGE